MKIKEITSQTRRDFTAIYECEHCGHTIENSGGYDDNFFHQHVIPNMICGMCGKKAPTTYKPLQTKYRKDEVV